MKTGVLCILLSYCSFVLGNDNFICKTNGKTGVVSIEHTVTNVINEKQLMAYEVGIETDWLNPTVVLKKCERIKKEIQGVIGFKWKAETYQSYGACTYGGTYKTIGFFLSDLGSELITDRPKEIWFMPIGNILEEFEKDKWQDSCWP